MSRIRALVVSVGTLGLWSGCVSDPTVEDEVPPQIGVTQPEAGSATVAALDACHDLVQAIGAARSRLGCPSPKTVPACPGYVELAGSLPCDEYEKASVDACVSAIGNYAACSDLDRSPCVVTVVTSSCHPNAPPPADAGKSDAEGGATEGEGGKMRDAPSDANGSGDGAGSSPADAAGAKDAGRD